MKPKPFKIDIQQSVLDDLQERLARTRWPDEPDGAGWDYGTDLEYMKPLVKYWQQKYDWRKHEAELNSFAQFKATINDVAIHFIHERSKKTDAPALVLTHGWPDSFYRFHKVIPLLTKDFDVVVPSLPGFGFSDRKSLPSTAIADLWAKLMVDVLGYKSFFAAGGDSGSSVTRALAAQHSDIVSAIHLTDVGYPMGQEDPSTFSKAEQEFAKFVQGWQMKEGAYNMVQATKPQSIAFSLNDSPVGLAAWIISMIDTGADKDNVEGAFGSKDELLTNIMIYWVTQTAGSAARWYLEDARAAYAPGAPKQEPSTVPASIALFPREAQFPKEWAERSVNVQRFTKMPKGGHFAALEVPEEYAKDVRESFAELA